MNEELLKYVSGGQKSCWVGRQPPYDMVAVDISKATNYRLSSGLHQKFDVVWICEKTLGDYGEFVWKLILDEAIRLIGENGVFIIREKNIGPVTPVEIKMFLGRHLAIDVFLQSENTDDSGMTYMVFDVKRKMIDKYQSQKWSFGVLTTGNKVDRVVELLKSIRSLEKCESEIIVAGPEDDAYTPFNVRYLDCSTFRDNLAEISRKKNAIADFATNPNLAIFHDRYSLSEDFFDGFDQYGYDFDFLSIEQITLNGERFPSIAIHIRYRTYGLQVIPKEFNKLCGGIYVNGGVMIFKTHMIQKIRFNDLLRWEQREDVELSDRFIMNGIVPRINYISSVNVLEMREGYMSAFLEEEKLPDGMRDAIFFSEMEHAYRKDLEGFFSNFDEDELYIFGAGVVTKCILALCTEKQKKNVKGILVSDCQNNPTHIDGIPVVHRDVCKDDNLKIVIGLLAAKQTVIMDDLKKYGINDSRFISLNQKANNAIFYLYNRMLDEKNEDCDK